MRVASSEEGAGKLKSEDCLGEAGCTKRDDPRSACFSAEGKEDSSSMVSGIEGSDSRMSTTTSGSKIGEIIWSLLSSISVFSAPLEIGVRSEENWASGSGIRDEAFGSAEVISSEHTDVKDDEENHENALDKEEQVKEVSGELKSGTSTASWSRLEEHQQPHKLDWILKGQQ